MKTNVGNQLIHIIVYVNKIIVFRPETINRDRRTPGVLTEYCYSKKSIWHKCDKVQLPLTSTSIVVLYRPFQTVKLRPDPVLGTKVSTIRINTELPMMWQ